jgi:hypothetical protein
MTPKRRQRLAKDVSLSPCLHAIFPSTQVVPGATAPMEVRLDEPPVPGTHIDQVVGESQTIEPGVQDPPAAGEAAAGEGAAGEGAAGEGAAGAEADGAEAGAEGAAGAADD